MRGGFASQDEADRGLREALGQVDQGTYVDPTKLTTGQYLVRWLAGLSRKPTTMDNYRVAIEAYAMPGHCPECALGQIGLPKLTADHLDVLYRHLERDGKRRGPGGLAPKTVRHVHTALHKALEDARERGYVVRNVAALANPPSQKQARSRKAQTDLWTPEQLGGFLADVAEDRMAAAWQLFCTTGMRRAEVSGLAWPWVDLAERELQVMQTLTEVRGKLVWSTLAEPTKTDAGTRVIALDPATTAVLRAHKVRQNGDRLALGPDWHEDAEHGALVFTRQHGHPVRPAWFLDELRRRAERLGLPVIDVHGLRHSYATAALKAGVNVHVLASRIGHADPATTLRVYSHVFRSDDHQAAALAAGAILARGEHSGSIPATERHP